MNPKSLIILAALAAFAWNGVASAETSADQSQTEKRPLQSVMELKLDDAVEKSANLDLDDEALLASLAGPTSMNCTNSGLEICVVTAFGSPQSIVPAALAQH